MTSTAPTTPAAKEGVASYQEKRPPNFDGLHAGVYVPKSINH